MCRELYYLLYSNCCTFAVHKPVAVNTRTSNVSPTCHIGRHQVKKLSMEAAGCFKVGRLKRFCVFTIPNTCRLRWQTPPKKVSVEKLLLKVARLCRTLLNSNRGIQCTQNLHVHVDFYTKKIENTVHISQNKRLSQSQNQRNIASNYVCTTQIAPPQRDDIIRRAKTSFAIKHAK